MMQFIESINYEDCMEIKYMLIKEIERSVESNIDFSPTP